MAMDPLLLVGLDEPETAELRRRLDHPILAFETLPRIRVDRGRLLVEHPHFMNHFVPAERVAFHAIFEDDFDFLTALALWGGPCLPGARGIHLLNPPGRELAVPLGLEQPPVVRVGGDMALWLALIPRRRPSTPPQPSTRSVQGRRAGPHHGLPAA
jgi:hypothetical protein